MDNDERITAVSEAGSFAKLIQDNVSDEAAAKLDEMFQKWLPDAAEQSGVSERTIAVLMAVSILGALHTDFYEHRSGVGEDPEHRSITRGIAELAHMQGEQALMLKAVGATVN